MINRHCQKLAILGIIMVLTGPSCSTTPAGRKQLNFVSDSEMGLMGRKAFKDIRKKTPYSTNYEYINRVDCIAKRMIDTVEGEYYRDWEFVIFNTEDINAFALPGRKVGIYEGIIRMTQNNHQLAAIIGHEISHVLSRHANERVSQAILTSGSLNVASLILAKKGQSERALMLSLLGLGANLGILLPFSRKHESEADRLGIMLMAKAGFNPQGAVDFWRVMDKNTRDGIPEFLSTHPDHGTRITNLERWVEGEATELYEKSRLHYSDCP